jgi:phage baseplate assembly protein W
MWKDVDIEFNKKLDGDINDMVDNDAIQNSLTNIWKTLQGSRRMLWPFASPSWGVLFEQIDEITSHRIGELLLQSIEMWEDRIQVENIHVVAKPDQNMYVVTLTYKVITEGDTSYIFTDVIRAV